MSNSLPGANSSTLLITNVWRKQLNITNYKCMEETAQHY